jgi:hypothetical protein
MLQDNGTASPAASSPGGWKWGSWRIPSEHLPLLVGAVCGGALILLTLIAAIVWRCCVVPRRDKAYCKSVILHQSFKTFLNNKKCSITSTLRSKYWLLCMSVLFQIFMNKILTCICFS